jgi:hypothetical protein
VWLSTRWHRPDGSYSTHQLAEDVTSLFLHGFAASGSRPMPGAKKANASVKAPREGASKV